MDVASGDAAVGETLARADALAGQGDLAAALPLWAVLRAGAAPLSVAWLRPARHLRTLRRLDEAEALLDEARTRFPDQPAAWAQWAAIAQDRRDWPEAGRRWAEIRDRFANLIHGFIGGAATLRDAGRPDAAEALLREAVQRFPNDPGPAVDFAALAQHGRQWDTAKDRWEQVRARFPERIAGPVGLATALRELGRPDEAEAVLLDARQRFPDDAAPLTELGWLAQVRQDWPKAVQRWAEVRARLPTLSIGYLRGATALRELGRPNRAAVILRAAIARFPHELQPYVDLGRLSAAGADWDEAERCWNDVMLRFPNAAEGPIGKAAVCRHRRQPAAADAVVEQAMRRLPGEAALAEQYGINAAARDDWPAAVARFEAAQQRFPAAAAIGERLAAARARLPPPAAAAPSIDDRTLIMAFESLGGTGHGCEFGIFQRAQGAEPLGLLRWADLPPASLCAVLESRFAGVGDPDCTRLFVPETTGRQEYWMGDKRHHMVTRCFVYPDEVPLDRMTRLVQQRMRFLSDKLVADLAAGSKVFVYKIQSRNLTGAELARLHAAVRAYGDNTLFYLRYEDAGHPNGTVEVRGPGLLVGYIDHFSHTADTNERIAAPHRQFLALCRRAYGLWQDGRTQRMPPPTEAA